MVDLGNFSFMDTSPDSLLSSLRTLAAERAIDVFLALEILNPEESDRTVFRNDSLITYRSVSVHVLGRFYSGAGSLIGTIKNTVSREETLPNHVTLDTYGYAIQSARELASRAVLELFPIAFLETVQLAFRNVRTSHNLRTVIGLMRQIRQCSSST